MARGSLALVLHAHLPFVRHPEHEDFLEERWFYEAVTETYVPLLEMLEGLDRDRVPPLLRPLGRGLLAARMRLRTRPRCRARARRIPLLLRRHPRHRACQSPPGLRRVRADRVRLRRGRLRSRPRQLQAGVERRGRLSGRLLVSRFLSRHRLRPRLRVRAPLPAPY